MAAPKAFASSGDLVAKEQTLEVLTDGVYALTAEGDPNVGAIEGEDFLVCFEAMATPVAAREWVSRLRQHTDKPVRYLVLSHYHAVRVLGASALLRLGLRAAIAVANEVDFAFEFVFVRTLPGCLEIGLIRVRRVVLIDRHRSHVAMVLDEPLGFSHVDRANAAVVLVIVASKAIGVVIAVAVIV